MVGPATISCRAPLPICVAARGPATEIFHFDDLFEVDRLTGGDGADQFILGDGLGSFYNDFGNRTVSTSNRAIITDFDASEGDIVVLHADSAYTVKIDGSTARLYLDDGAGGGTATSMN